MPHLSSPVQSTPPDSPLKRPSPGIAGWRLVGHWIAEKLNFGALRTGNGATGNPIARLGKPSPSYAQQVEKIGGVVSPCRDPIGGKAMLHPGSTDHPPTLPLVIRRISPVWKTQAWKNMRGRRFRPFALFCVTLAIVFLGQTFTPAGLPGATAVGPEIRGVWLTSNDMDVMLDRPKLEAAFDQLASLNFNTLYPVVWNSGYVLYPSTTAQQEGIQPFVRRGFQDYDVLAEVIRQAHQRGLMVMPWFEFGFMTPPTSELARNHPDWLTQKRDGSKTWVGAAGEVVWLNPFKQEVQQFLLNLVAEVCNQYNIDGIQFDDHISLPVEFGYDRYTRTLYHQETGRVAPNNPRDPAWMKWRADKITHFVSKLKQVLETKKPGSVLSIAPNPYDTAYNSYLQDWVTWVNRDLADEIIIQVYRHEMDAFVNQLTRPEVQATRRKIPTGVGVLTGLRTKPVPIDFIQQKVYAARRQGLGVSFFYYESLWEEAAEPLEERLAGLEQLFPWPAQRLALEVRDPWQQFRLTP